MADEVEEEEERQQLQLADGRAGFGDGVQPKGGKKMGGGGDSRGGEKWSRQDASMSPPNDRIITALHLPLNQEQPIRASLRWCPFCQARAAEAWM